VLQVQTSLFRCEGNSDLCYVVTVTFIFNSYASFVFQNLLFIVFFRAKRQRGRRPDVRTDRLDENNSRFSQFCERAWKQAHIMLVYLTRSKFPVSRKALSWGPNKKPVVSWPFSLRALLSSVLLGTCCEGTSRNLLAHLPTVNPSFP